MKELVRGLLVALLLIWWIGCPMSGPSDEGVAPGESETGIWYVSATAEKGGNGRSWAQPFRHPQEAVNAAGYGEAVKVSEGMYGPWTGNPDGAVVVMKPGVELYGGYHLVDGQVVQRNPGNYPSELWGASYGELESDWLQAVHIVLGASDSRLDGFTIVEGNTCLDPGGSDLYAGSLDNPDYWGAAMWNDGVEKLRVHDCRFAHNQAEVGGGALFNVESQVDVTKCQFWFNVAWRDVGGGADPGCYGGAIAARGGTLRIENSLFVSNSAGTVLGADGWGGAIAALPGAEIRVTHCTFCGNDAEHGYTLYDAPEGPGEGLGGIEVMGSILWRQSVDAAISHIEAEHPIEVSYSDVQLHDSLAVYPGTGNINEDPLFEGGTYPALDNYRVKFTSPCTDGVPAEDSLFDDLVGSVRNGADGWVQMGALENPKGSDL